MAISAYSLSAALFTLAACTAFVVAEPRIEGKEELFACYGYFYRARGELLRIERLGLGIGDGPRACLVLLYSSNLTSRE